jgi:hypothetical protein
MTVRLFRNVVLPAGVAAALFWFVRPGKLEMIVVCATVALAAIVPIVLLSRVPKLARQRTTRRVAVVVAYGGIAVYGGTWVFASIAGVSDAAIQALNLGLVALVAGVLAFGIVLVWNRNSRSLSGDDERLIVRRDKTYAAAFQVLALACAAECALWSARASITLPKMVDYTSLFLVTDLFLGLSLPAVILAWGDPGAVDD